MGDARLRRVHPSCIPGMHRLWPLQIPGGERAFAAKVKSGSLRSSLVLGFDESLPDRLRPDEPVHLTEQRAYRGRPKSGRQW